MVKRMRLIAFMFLTGVTTLVSSRIGEKIISSRVPQLIGVKPLRGGSGLHTGKFVIEHRRSDQSMQRQASTVSSLDDLYDVHGVLGEGGFATVRRGTHRITKNVYAIKTIDLCKIRVDQLDSLRNEVNIMKMLDHPNVVKLYETFEEENKLHLVLELCEGGDLFEFIMKTSIESGQKTWTDGSVRIIAGVRLLGCIHELLLSSFKTTKGSAPRQAAKNRRETCRVRRGERVMKRGGEGVEGGKSL